MPGRRERGPAVRRAESIPGAAEAEAGPGFTTHTAMFQGYLDGHPNTAVVAVETVVDLTEAGRRWYEREQGPGGSRLSFSV